MLTSNDYQQLQEKGITEAQLQAQLERFAQGFPFLRLEGAAAIGHGIFVPTEAEREAYANVWDIYCEGNHALTKFVPASGAASRMFKDLFAFIEASYDVPTTDFEQTFFAHLAEAAFRPDLDAACSTLYGKDTAELLAEGRYKAIVKALLDADGLNYGQLPKGLLKFHAYADGAHTPVEEHLVEGALYARGKDGCVRIHFTVSPEHRALFEQLVERVVPKYEARFGVRYEVSFSEQKPYTDTVAATPQNEPFRNDDGSLLFRPAGHGALIENLNEIPADVVFVKTVDNVAPERLNADTVHYKRVLAGLLVSAQAQVFNYLQLLDGEPTVEQLHEMLDTLKNLFTTWKEGTETLSKDALTVYLRQKLNRPLRVCGMVRNVGEPGGGPFLAYNADGSVSPQILESSQIEMSDPVKKAMFEQGTHFNPVDLVCALKDYKGRPFDLKKFVDPATGFISHKSKSGRELKALELPGLWNGAMSDWNTIFVEVPLTTFNPVKTVNDLFREQHR